MRIDVVSNLCAAILMNRLLQLAIKWFMREFARKELVFAFTRTYHVCHARHFRRLARGKIGLLAYFCNKNYYVRLCVSSLGIKAR